ncbi:MAG: Holliday junction branch migration protein RuvA [Flavobacteriales bacterium]
MIAHIQGKLVEKNPAYAVLECNGVGYHLNISLNTYSALPDNEDCKLYTKLIVREDAQELYGFHSREEREIFLNLIAVSGVGANTGIMILSSLNPDEVRNAIAEGDTNTLKNIKGIGARSAQRIIVDLKDKIGKQENISESTTSQSNTLKNEALSALIALGIPDQKAEKTLKEVTRKQNKDISVEQLVKLTLKKL